MNTRVLFLKDFSPRTWKHLASHGVQARPSEVCVASVAGLAITRVLLVPGPDLRSLKYHRETYPWDPQLVTLNVQPTVRAGSVFFCQVRVNIK